MAGIGARSAVRGRVGRVDRAPAGERHERNVGQSKTSEPRSTLEASKNIREPRKLLGHLARKVRLRGVGREIRDVPSKGRRHPFDVALIRRPPSTCSARRAVCSDVPAMVSVGDLRFARGAGSTTAPRSLSERNACAGCTRPTSRTTGSAGTSSRARRRRSSAPILHARRP